MGAADEELEGPDWRVCDDDEGVVPLADAWCCAVPFESVNASKLL